ncbi:MAG: helix-turn-helix transcriptional regulator [Chloroflexi bacterium]|nr:transcriptional regulator [Chloroflexota bacterium]NOH11008.1 helix-turn-helix transcriptional regulator [Chloroflexota bacterium]
MLDSDEATSRLLKAISAPPRLKIMRAMGAKEVCVCHLEAVFPEWRQAFISQHLMALRKANVLVSRKEGRFVFYRLRDTNILGLINLAAEFVGVDLSEIKEKEGCDCPGCQTFDKKDIQVVATSIQ